MKNLVYFILFCAVLSFSACSDFWGSPGGDKPEEIVAVANRGSGSVSFLNAKNNNLLETVDLPGEAEPMYVVYVAFTDKVYVGDRAQNLVHVLDPETFETTASIEVGNGVFHMWAGGNGNALWVNNDIDNTVSVIDLDSQTVISTINLDGKPHDVFLTDDGTRAYISILRPDGPDQIYAYNALSYEQTATQEVGEDPHLFHLSKKNKLFVPCQNTNQLLTLNGEDLSVLADTPLDGAHGIYGTLDQKKVYVTGINVSKLYQITSSRSTLSNEVNTNLPIPHNVVVNARGNKAFVTHSGGDAESVSIFTIKNNGSLKEKKVLTTGTNPFGLAYYYRSR